MSHNITVQGGTSVRLPTAGKYCEQDIIVTAEGGTEDLNAVLTEQEALIDELKEALQGKASGCGTELEDALITHTVVSEYANDRVTFVGYGTFYGSANLKSISFLNATSIEDYAFYGCRKLDTMNIPHLKTVGAYAFLGANFASLDLTGVETVETYGFANMPQCKSIKAPHLITVTASAFRGTGTTLLTVADLGCATSIGAMAFYWNKNLETLIIRTESLCALANTNALSNSKIAGGTGYIYVPSALVDSYKAATNWSNYASQFRAIEDYPDICGG